MGRVVFGCGLVVTLTVMAVGVSFTIFGIVEAAAGTASDMASVSSCPMPIHQAVVALEDRNGVGMYCVGHAAYLRGGSP